MDTQTNGSTSKYDYRSMFTYDCVSACKDVSTESNGVQGIMCPYISTKGMGVHRFKSTDDSTVNTVVRGRTNMYDEYGR